MKKSGNPRRSAAREDTGIAACTAALLFALPLSGQTQPTDAAAARERGASVPVQTALLLSGKPFPPPPEKAPPLPEPRRTLFVAPGSENGDGSEKHPWNDLQAALRALSPGDRLRVRAGGYTGPISIDAACRDGEPAAPIQVVFDGKAVVSPPDEGVALTLRRAHWRLVGLFVELGNSAAVGVALESGANEVALDGTRVSGGRGPGIRVGAGVSRAAVRGSLVAKPRVANPGAGSFGIQVLGGAASVVLQGNQLHENPAGSIRVEAPAGGGRAARDLLIVGNTVRDDDSTAIRVVAADDLRLVGNTVSDQAGRPATRGIVLERVTRAVVRSNHVSRCALALQVGRVEPGAAVNRAEDVTIDHNVFQNAPRSGVALAIEAGDRVRFVNNVVNGYANGLLVLGQPPATRRITAANNLLLGVAETALRLPDPAAAADFDYNVFAPAGAAWVEVGGRQEPLVRWVKARLPHSTVAPSARILGNDLARIEGVPTVDRGRRIDGVEFKGAAPDIGVADR